MDDVVSRYREASESNDIEGLLATLSPDAELYSPISGRMVFRGANDLRVLFGAVYGSLRGLQWRSEMHDGSRSIVLGNARIGPFKIDDAMVFELAPDGRIERIRPHLRPWLALTFFALVLGPKVARHPGTVLRALRG
ncbi:MAG TPA: nuclear transport factor 2 family protein [Solirubrobacteraceae bacterium]|nr:nuclear transport factor 2 family protein [Solirubrobacteraceae bacterium]